MLAAGTPDGHELLVTGNDDERLGTLVDAGVAAEVAAGVEASAVSVEVQPADVPEPGPPRPSAGAAIAARPRPRPLGARAATVSTSTTSPPMAVKAQKAPAATTAAPARPPVATTRPSTTVAPAPTSSSDAVWDRLAQCESGNTNDHDAPYYGYWQFSEATWLGLGQVGLPDDHSRAEQLVVAKRLQAMSGWRPWPGCARALGLL